MRDSPVGLAAYILEKFSTWTQPKWMNEVDGGFNFSDKPVKKEDGGHIMPLTALLDNVMLYYVTNSITTSMRIYSENFSTKHLSKNIDSIPAEMVPASCARLPSELFFAPAFAIRDKFPRVVKISDLPRGAIAAGFAILFRKFSEIPPLPQVKDTWWGLGEQKPGNFDIIPFTINISSKVLADLNDRLDLSLETLTPPLDGTSFEYGFNADTLRKIIHFWRHDYDWKTREKYLNSIPQFKTRVAGLNIHFIHAKPMLNEEDAKSFKILPILMLHGWPGSFREMYEIIPLLTTPKKESSNHIFELVIPSLCGFGFSEGAYRPGLTTTQIGLIMKKLMHRIGFSKFYVQGGDWGAIIASDMATFFHESIMDQQMRAFLKDVMLNILLNSSDENFEFISMGIKGALLFLILAGGASFLYTKMKSAPPLPELEDIWWGEGDPKTESDIISPFKVGVPMEVLEVLKRRLDTAVKTLVSPLEGVNFEYGFNTDTLRKVVHFWRNNYDWREREKYLNSVPQFTTKISGLRMHFIHVKPNLSAKDAKSTRVIPLLMLHGWPGSVREMYDIIPLLTEPRKGYDYVFEVVVPSLPGYGFSEGAQSVLGVHSNMCGAMKPFNILKLIIGSFTWPTIFADKTSVSHLYPLSQTFSFLMRESGYMHIQATKPDTVGLYIFISTFLFIFPLNLLF
ncbi:hypothetical protein J437_LFUL008257 [Ladona fulva]|uniref:Epoxide hydrolase N-terminal domain-containing protein n=1 Tax=Ladona fulva TaxID=123851 RepID=A0A8K0P1R9_LADFU|nr:hypothetical protein J437_LFUL008257 [Ladona fulva]